LGRLLPGYIVDVVVVVDVVVSNVENVEFPRNWAEKD
jgi:hypothetical protein